MTKNRALPKIKDEKESKRRFHEWFREFVAASRALDQARGRVERPVGPSIQSAIFKPLNIEGDEPTVVGLRSTNGGQSNGVYPQNPESAGIFRLLVFLKHGITFRELIGQMDVDKNPAAHRKLLAVHRDYWRMISGIPHSDLRLKFGFDHFQIIVQGFDFGLHKLAPADLAECLDNICPCEQKHSLEYIKKLRTRIKQACKRIT
jgi:hypothetical protein